jgi:branched-chain amino acid transport system permease protein
MEILLQQIINGLVLGSMYALVALGYTMVYGIINLINFAHGEVLMVGALTSWTIIGMMQGAMPGLPGWVVLIVAMVIACVVAAALNFTIEKGGLPAPAQQPQAGAADHRHRHVHPAADAGHDHLEAQLQALSHLLPATRFKLGGAVITPTQIMILG